MAEADKDLQKAIDDHLKRLYEQYKSNNKVFTATHIGHLTLSIIFVISILFPFFYLQIDAHKTNAELERLSQSIAQQEQRAAVYRQAMTGLKKLFQAVENTPKPLDGYIQALEKEAAGGPTAPVPDSLKLPPEACGSPSDRDSWMECQIRQYMAARAAQYQDVLAKEIAAPLEKLGIKEFDQSHVCVL
jgi:cell division protein FtsL